MAPKIRPETPAEAEAVLELHRAAFGGPREAAVVAGVRASPLHRPGWSLVAAEGSELLGHILLCRVGLWGRDGVTREIAVIAPLAVRPSRQGGGLGSRLVAAALEAASEPLVVARGKPGFWARQGFRPAAEFGVHAPFAVPGEEYRLRPLAAYSEAYRGTVRYPAAFAAVGYPVEF